MHSILLTPSAADTLACGAKTTDQAISGLDMINAADEIIKEIQNINNLLKEKNKIINKIGAIMNLKAYTKTKMSKTQIKQFMHFNRQCIENTNKLSDIFNEMDSIIKPDLVRGETLHKTDMANIYKKFADISERQKIASNSLKELLAVGNYTIFILCRK